MTILYYIFIILKYTLNTNNNWIVTYIGLCIVMLVKLIDWIKPVYVDQVHNIDHTLNHLISDTLCK